MDEAPTVIRDTDPPPPPGSISGDSIQDRAMQSVLRGTICQSGLGHGTTAPQIEALEGQYWGARLLPSPSLTDFKKDMVGELELARGIEPPTG